MLIEHLLILSLKTMDLQLKTQPKPLRKMQIIQKVTIEELQHISHWESIKMPLLTLKEFLIF